MAQKTDDVIVDQLGPVTRVSRNENEVVAGGGNADAGNDETEHLKAQIEETRSQMGETIDALQERLSFSNISDQVSEHVNHAIETAKNTVYDATIGKAVGFMKNMGDGITDSKLVRTARNYPFPFLLIGLGAGLLAYNSLYRRRGPARLTAFRSRDNDFPERSDIDRSAFDKVAEKTNGLTGRVSAAASSAYEGVSQAMDTAVTGVRDVANRAYSKAGEYGHSAVETYDHYLEENPLAVGAAAFALGAVVGLAIPATRYEGRLMGETRDDLLRMAQNKGSALLDKTRHLVGEATDNLSKEGRNIIH